MGSWDFERGVLVFMGVLILGGLGFIWYEDGVAEELQSKLGTSEQQLGRIGAIADQVFDLQDEILEDVVASGKSGPYQYIEQQAVDSRIGKSSFNIAPPSDDKHQSEGYEDTRFVLTPAQHAAAKGQDDFTRQEIANFLLYIEGNTTRMRVTRIRLDLSDRSSSGNDLWKPTLTITDRHPITQS